MAEPPEPRVRYSRHAVERMRQRRIDPGCVEEALREPAQLLYDKAKDVYIALSPDGDCAAVYAYRGSLVEVVTVLGRREYEALVGRLGSRRYRLVA